MTTRTINSSSALEAGITPIQRAAFERDGFLHFKGFLNADAVADMRRAIDELEARWVREGVTVVNGTPVKFGRNATGGPMIQRFSFASLHHPAFAELLRDPRFQALLQLVDGDARLGTHEKDGLVINHYLNTEGSNFTQMGWHTDAIRDLFLGKRIGPMLNVGIHLDDQDPRNGGLRLLPGTHHQGLRGMLFHKRYYVDKDPDPREVAFDIQAGDLTVHDGRLWHRVQRSSLVGEASRRRVMYIPIINGPYQPRSAKSRTPFYHRFQHMVK
ncbi:MAG TPA: phytanoyl-CoA dioxygenase family protein [Flavobacteriales bacterium]|jgi:ectoine hydroxylase-related dioxygenase (phytanoyl-CoA dioxygenase family)|nr:phytanoyl-CoA dioxygenase family protein [Flavobacteriales bacterium]